MLTPTPEQGKRVADLLVQGLTAGKSITPDLTPRLIDFNDENMSARECDILIAALEEWAAPTPPKTTTDVLIEVTNKILQRITEEVEPKGYDCHDCCSGIIDDIRNIVLVESALAFQDTST